MHLVYYAALAIITGLILRLFLKRKRAELNSLHSKVVLITGGGSGIGRDIALLCARHGAKVAICGRRMNKLEKVAAEIEEIGGDSEVLPFKADMAKQDDIKQFVDATIAKFKSLDFVFINHMFGRVQKLEDIPEDELYSAYNDAFDSTVFGMIGVTYYTLPHLKRNPNGGRLVLVSSMSSFYGVPKCGLYAATKAAGHRFIDCVRIELTKNTKVKLTIACPGLIDTQTARDYIPASDMAGSMPSDLCAKQVVEAGIAGVREEHMNLLHKPPIYGSIVYYISVLIPWAMDYLMYWTYDFEKGEGIADACPPHPDTLVDE